MRVSCLLLCVLCAGVYLLSSYSLPTVAVFAAIAAAREINNSFPEAKKRSAMTPSLIEVFLETRLFSIPSLPRR